MGVLSRWSQSNRLFSIETPLGPDVLLLEGFSGTESVSQPFRFQLQVLSEDACIELKTLMGALIKVSLETAFGRKRYFNGHVIQFAQIGSDGGMATYRAVIGPWLEFLRYRINCEIFQAMSVLDILRKVFGRYGGLAKFEIGAQSGKYKPITLCVQYQESDLDFAMRLMEESGLYFFFTFEKGGHTLHIEDDSTLMRDMPFRKSIEFNQIPGAAQDDAIDGWASERELVSNSVALKTFDFKKPKAPMKVAAKTTHSMGDLPELEHYEFGGHYAFDVSSTGENIAKLRMEALEVHSKRFTGSGNARHLTAGHHFELLKHYDIGKDALDRTFFVLSVTHDGKNNFKAESSQGVYRNSFTCVRRLIPFRPALLTRKPAMAGPHTATVVGPAGEEIHTDKYGRVKIQFHWDREGEFNENSCCWVRVASQWVGGRFGMVSLPRIGAEVLVEFLDGNPDRPVITGMLYNEIHMPPWVLPDNRTQSGILSRSSRDGGYDNANALRFEDCKGKEEVWLHAEKDQRIEVENDEGHFVGHDRKKDIKNNETTSIGVNRTESVGANEDIIIGANRTEKVGGNESITIMQAKSETVALASAEQVGLGRNLAVGAAYTIEVGAAMNTAVGLAQYEEIGLDKTTIVGKDQTTKVSKKILIDAGDELTIVVGKAQFTMKKDGTITLNGKSISLTSTADTTIKAKGNFIQKGQKILGN